MSNTIDMSDIYKLRDWINIDNLNWNDLSFIKSTEGLVDYFIAICIYWNCHYRLFEFKASRATRT